MRILYVIYHLPRVVILLILLRCGFFKSKSLLKVNFSFQILKFIDGQI